MKNVLLRSLFFAGACAGFSLAHAQIVTLNATINSAQETTGSTSPATGTAIMMYDVSKNTYDLLVTINNLTNTIANSHIHEAAPGIAGSVVAPIGAESVYTRNGTTVTGSFHGLAYGGDPKTLLSGGSYYNVHSSQYPGGEVRGQLVPQPKRLYANINVAQEQAAVTNGSTINSNANGAAVMWYDPATKNISVRISMYNFANTFANSHFHEAAPGVGGSVVTGLGGASAYTSGGGGFYNGSFDLPYTGDPVKLLTGGAYLNFHSNVYPAGEMRGQVWPDEELGESRVINVSARGTVGADVLITGFSIVGPQPVRVLITAKGPSLSAYGVTNALSDPALWLYDSAGRLIASNNDVGTPTAGTDLAKAPGVPKNAVESALLIVLPPGNYTTIVSGNNGATGNALIEVTDMRVASGSLTAAAVTSDRDAN